MPIDGWEFWKVTTTEDGELAWLAITRPGARAIIDRDKVWSLLPKPRVFIANWFLTEAFADDGGGRYTYENIDIDEARELVTEVPDVPMDVVQRITRPERVLALEQVDRYPALKVLGKRADAALQDRY